MSLGRKTFKFMIIMSTLIVVRVMRYKYSSGNIPSNHELVKVWRNKGMALKYNTTTGEYRSNCYISMLLAAAKESETKLAAFPSYRSIKVIIGGSSSQALNYVHPQGFSANGYTLPYRDGVCQTTIANWSECESIPSSVLEGAWKQGIVMILYWKDNLYIYNSPDIPLSSKDVVKLNFYEIADIMIEDNFGNGIYIGLNWDYTKKYCRDWKVISTRVDH